MGMGSVLADRVDCSGCFPSQCPSGALCLKVPRAAPVLHCLGLYNAAWRRQVHSHICLW